MPEFSLPYRNNLGPRAPGFKGRQTTMPLPTEQSRENNYLFAPNETTSDASMPTTFEETAHNHVLTSSGFNLRHHIRSIRQYPSMPGGIFPARYPTMQHLA